MRLLCFPDLRKKAPAAAVLVEAGKRQQDAIVVGGDLGALRPRGTDRAHETAHAARSVPGDLQP